MKKHLPYFCSFLFLPAPSRFFTLSDTRFKTGSYYRTYRLLFDLGKAPVLPACYPSLDSLAAFPDHYPGMQLEIGVHSDFRGSDSMNEALTQARAISIQNYLLSKGINASRLKAKGYGETKPLITEKEMKQKQHTENYPNVNRRVEFKITAL